MQYKGKVIFFNGTYGYISSKEFPIKLYFHRNDVQREYRDKIKRGDEVSFVAKPNLGKPGQWIAVDVIFERFIHPTLNSLRIKYDPKDIVIGKLISWNGRLGHIRSPILKEKDTFIFYTRLLESSVTVGDILVFEPVDSIDPRSTYFAKFAEPIHLVPKEDLFIALEENGQNEYPYLDAFLETHYLIDFLTHKMLLEADNGRLEHLENLIRKYVAAFGQLPQELLQGFPVDIQIFLWDKQIIKEVSEEVLLLYFQRAPSNIKSQILDREHDSSRRTRLQEKYTIWFLETKQHLKVNRELKPFLHLVNEYSYWEETAYNQLFKVLQRDLPPEKLVGLWLSGHLKRLHSVDFAVQHLDFLHADSMDALLSFPDEDTFAKEVIDASLDFVLSALFERSFIDFSPVAAAILKYFHERGPNFYIYDILPNLKNNFAPDQQFILQALGAHIDVDASTLLHASLSNLNLVYLILYDLQESSFFTEHTFTSYVGDVTVQDRLKDDLLAFPWSDFWDPAEFLKEKLTKWKLWGKFFPFVNEDEKLALHLFEGLSPKYTVHHLRLYIVFQKALADRLDFYGFMEPFKNLKKGEKKVIREALNDNIEDNFITMEREEVKPCTSFTEKGGAIEYNATICNIYFGDENMTLRLPDGTYTAEYDNISFASTALNHIPSNHPIAKREMKILVKDGVITDIDGLGILLNEIYWRGIKSVLSTTIWDGVAQQGDVAYVIDLELKQKVIRWLEKNQLPNYPPVLVYEGTDKNDIRRKNAKSEQVFRQYLCHLYSLDVDDGVVIIWESAEFDESNATYIFKSSVKNHAVQINRLVEAIGGYKNLRSYISSTFRSETSESQKSKLAMQKNLRNYLGYVGNIRKGRGKANAFDAWQTNLHGVIMNTPCPETVDDFDPELIAWEDYGLVLRRGAIDKIPNKKIVKKVKISKENDFPDYPSGDKVPLEEILANLQNLNQNFLRNLNI